MGAKDHFLNRTSLNYKIKGETYHKHVVAAHTFFLFNMWSIFHSVFYFIFIFFYTSGHINLATCQVLKKKEKSREGE